MKIKNKILLLIIIIFCFGCTTNVVHFIPEVKIVNTLDLRKYSNKDFLITTETLNGDYDSIGMLYCKVLPSSHRQVVFSKHEPTEAEKKRGITTEIGRNQGIAWVQEELILDSVVDIAYEKAVAMGGDSIMEFSLTAIVEDVNVNFNEKARIYGYEISGFIIKRK